MKYLFQVIINHMLQNDIVFFSLPYIQHLKLPGEFMGRGIYVDTITTCSSVQFQGMSGQVQYPFILQSHSLRGTTCLG